MSQAGHIDEHARPWGLLADYKAEITMLRAMLAKVQRARTLAEAKKAATR